MRRVSPMLRLPARAAIPGGPAGRPGTPSRTRPMTDTPPEGSAQGTAPDARAPQFRVLGQYVRDSSFENPGAPASLRSGQGSPQIELGVDMSARRIDADTEEVSLRI